jgi:polyvinyl alcohol dehydrogenase (cytochrome)
LVKETNNNQQISRRKINMTTLTLVILLSVFAIYQCDWLGWGQSITNTRHVDENNITIENAQSLSVLWTINFPGSSGSATASPTVVTINDIPTLFFCDYAGYVQSVNGLTGALIWKKKLSGFTQLKSSWSKNSPAYANGVVVVGDLQTPRLIGLNATNGKMLWKNKLTTQPYARVRNSVTIYNNQIFFGLSSSEEIPAGNSSYPCCIFRGRFYSLDLMTGVKQWEFYTTPPNKGLSGAGVFGSNPSVDAARGIVYFTTGNNYRASDLIISCINNNTVTDKTTCFPSNNYAISVIALRISDGSKVWARKFSVDIWSYSCQHNQDHPHCPPGYSHDYDFVQAPMIFDYPGKVPMIVVGRKSGDLYAMDRTNGDLLWTVSSGPSSGGGGIDFGSSIDGTIALVANSNTDGKAYVMANGQSTSTAIYSGVDILTGTIIWQITTSSTAKSPVSSSNGIAYFTSDSSEALVVDSQTGNILKTLNSALTGSVTECGPSINNGIVYWPLGTTLYAYSIPNDKK